MADTFLAPFVRPIPKLLVALLLVSSAAAAEKPAVKKQATRRDRYGDPLPDGVLARLGTNRLRADGGVALSPDGKAIITATGGGQVKWWGADTGKLIEQRALPIRVTYQAFLSPNGRFLAVREPDFDTPIDIWDTSSGKRLHRLPMPQATGIYRAAFSPDSKTLAVSEMGGTKPVIRLWNMETGVQRFLTGHAGNAESLAFTTDSKLLATSDGRSVICWDLAKGERLWQTRGAFNIALAFTPDGKVVIASPGSGERAWHAWDAATGKVTDTLKLPTGYNYAYSVVAPDGRTLIFAQSRNVQGADGRVRVWDLRDGKLLRTLPAEGLTGLFFPDGKSFLTRDGRLQRWELATGRPLLPSVDEQSHRSEICCLTYSPDGRRVASADRQRAICLWDIATTKPLHVVRGHDTIALSFTPDGKFLVSGGTEGDLRVWDVQTAKEARRIRLHDPQRGEKKQNVWKLHVTPDGQRVIVLSYDDPDDGRTGGILTSWELTTGQRKTRAETETRDVFYSGFSPNGRLLASHGELLDTNTGASRVKLAGVPDYLPHYVFSPDGRYVAGHRTHSVQEGMRFSTLMEGIQIWEVATGRAVHLIKTDWVGYLAFSPDGRYLAAGDLQGLRLWEWETGKVVLQHRAHEKMRGSFGDSFASCLAFSPDGRSLATGHVDSTVLIWNMVPSTHPATAADLPRLWDDLKSSDAAKAYAASWRLTDAPPEAIRFLRERLRPVVALPAQQVRPLLADLDSEDFSKRQAAIARLRALDDRAESFLREALKDSPSLEKRRRVEELLKELQGPPTGETLRTLRALVVLERIGTAEARQLLRKVAEGMPEARVTHAAKAALERNGKAG